MRSLQLKAPWRRVQVGRSAVAAVGRGCRTNLPSPLVDLMGGRCAFAASSRTEPASSESAASLLHLIQVGDKRDEVDELAEVEGTVLSVAGGIVRIELPGPVAIGHAVNLGGDSLGVVLRYDKRGVVAAPVTREVPRQGAPVVVRGVLSSRVPEASGQNIVYASVSELLGTCEEIGTIQESLLRLPQVATPQRRQLVRRHLPSGLAAAEAMLPFGEGQRIGFVGPPGTGKTRAAAMLLASQKPDTVCVFATETPLPQLKSILDTHFTEGSSCVSLRVVHAGAQDPPGARYLLPLCAMQLASELRSKHRHVLLVLDDLVGFAAAADELGVPPLGAPHALAAALSAAGCVESPIAKDSALSLAVVLDLDSDEDTLTPTLRDLWRGAEELLDIHLSFSTKVAASGVMPAVDLDHLLQTCGLHAPGYQAPLMKHLRKELLAKLRQGRDLEQSIEVKRDLGLHIEVDEAEELASSRTARALLTHAAPRPFPELAVLACAAVVLHFPPLGGSRQPTRTAIERFQRAVIQVVREDHPALWNSICALESLEDAAATGALKALAEVLLMHRFDFALTRPEL